MRNLSAWILLLVCGLAMLTAGGCPAVDLFPPSLNPFTDLAPVELDGREHDLATTIAPLGEQKEGTVLRLKASGEGIESVYVLIADTQSTDAGVMVGGGPANAFFDYRVPMDGRYFVWTQFNPSIKESEQRASLTGVAGDAAFRPPSRQQVLVVFQPDYLISPGLADPESFTDEERQLLADLQDLVQVQVLQSLREIFANTPIEILGQSDPLPSAPFSRLTYSPQYMPAENQAIYDAALPSVDPNSPCAQPVIFGEVLPRGSRSDPGNQRPDDEAMVYVGSFQGRGLACRSAVVESLNNIVLALSHTGAHEIGHLVGLVHVSLVDIMDRRPSSAFQRRLVFGRGQTLIEIPVVSANGTVTLETRVQTSILQDPTLYFQSIFDVADINR